MLTNFTKAGHLQYLKTKISSAEVLTVYKVKYGDWCSLNADARMQLLNELLGQEAKKVNWAIRSSHVDEDQITASNAGKYLSELNVPINGVVASIDRVFASYFEIRAQSEVLIQRYLENTKMSGVAFSHDQDTGAPYRIYNWVIGSDTEAITGGKTTGLTYVALPNNTIFDINIKRIDKLISELLALLKYQAIEIEYAISSDDILFLFQVRPLILASEAISNKKMLKLLKATAAEVDKRFTNMPLLAGDTTIYAMMPDWNPAEIIGPKPKPLSLSIYKNIITDSIWAYQRSNYGYRNLRGFPLLIDLLGAPFIDVRVCFNSMVPNDLSDAITTKLVNAYLNHLKNNPELHDKVEFEVVISCYHFDLEKKFKNLTTLKLTDNEKKQIKSSLLKLTNKIINKDFGLWLNDVEKISTLSERRESILKSEMPLTEKVYWLLEDCKRYGTLPFAGIARAAFVAIEMLNSMKAQGLLTRGEAELFMSTISTVNKKLIHDRHSMTECEFLEEYGHLRPGTYDITSMRYDQAYEHYFEGDRAKVNPLEITSPFKLSAKTIKKLTDACASQGLTTNAQELFDFMRNAIEWREKAKFEFTKNVSAALELIAELGATLNLDREALSYLSIDDILNIQSSPGEISELITGSIKRGKSRYSKTAAIRLPEMITSPNNMFGFMISHGQPNFVTNKSVSAKTCSIDYQDTMAGKIVFIPNADPGYDWIFTKEIAGLVTEWGGANSHMAIRASELGLPAVIGAGQVNYNKWRSKEWIRIDCNVQRVEYF